MKTRDTSLTPINSNIHKPRGEEKCHAWAASLLLRPENIFSELKEIMLIFSW